jgi:hypothetical protein
MFTPSAPQSTLAGAQPTEQMTSAGRDMARSAEEATVIERSAGPRGSSAADEATVLERFDTQSAAPTQIEAKGAWGGSAAPTVLERQISPPAPGKRNRALMMSAAAAAFVIVVAIVIAMMWKKPEAAPVATGTGDAVVTEGTPTMPPDQGVLLLSASPWGDLDRIVSKSSQQEITLSDDHRSTPARIELEPGEYVVTLSGPAGRRTVDVQIEAGRPTEQHISMGRVDIDALAKEFSKP